MDYPQRMLATIHADMALLDLLQILKNLHSTRPDRVGQASQYVKKATETHTNIHRTGGATSDQIKSIEKNAARIKDLLG